MFYFWSSYDGPGTKVFKIHRTFEKGYLPGWTEEVFVVHRVLPGVVPTYKIREWDDTLVKGTFYEADLQKVHVSDDALFRIEKVLKSKCCQKSNIFEILWQQLKNQFRSYSYVR